MIEDLIRKFDLSLNDPRTYRDVFRTGAEDVYGQIDKIESIRFKAIAGDPEAEAFMIEKLSMFLYAYAGKGEYELIDFGELSGNPPDIRLILLLETVGLHELILKYCSGYVFTDEAMDTAFRDSMENIGRRFANLKERIRLTAKMVFANVYGLGIINFLRGKYINEIGATRKDHIYIITGGRKVWIKAAALSSNEAMQNILKKASLNSNSPFDKANPISISTRRNTDRVSIAGYDVTPDDNEYYLNIRIFNLLNITLEELRDVYHTIDDDMLSFLEINQKGKGSFFVTGADMNVGKSTMLLAMLNKTPAHFGIGIIDPQNEMRVSAKYPEKNTITLISNELKTTDECFEYLLKTSRDVIAVSEITNPNEVTQLINGALRLNCGICATMHSLDPDEVLPNLRNMMMRTEMYINEKTAEEDVKRGIDLIIHLKRIKARIVVDSIDEITFSGLNRLMAYHENAWIRIAAPSEKYYRKIRDHLEEKDIETYERIFGKRHD